MRVRRTPIPLLVPVLALAVGCGASDRQPVFPAHGQVLYEGKPIPHALITLHPLDVAAKDAPRPHGSVDKDGSFVLTTYAKDDGAPAGEYGVTVEWWLSSTASRTQEGDSPPPTNRLPQRYARVETSRLRVRIAAGDNPIPVIKLSR